MHSEGVNRPCVISMIQLADHLASDQVPQVDLAVLATGDHQLVGVVKAAVELVVLVHVTLELGEHFPVRLVHQLEALPNTGSQDALAISGELHTAHTSTKGVSQQAPRPQVVEPGPAITRADKDLMAGHVKRGHCVFRLLQGLNRLRASTPTIPDLRQELGLTFNSCRESAGLK